MKYLFRYSLLLAVARRSHPHLLLTLLAAARTASAVPPGNDHFTNAFALGGYRGGVSVPTTEATKEALEPAHAGNGGGASVWFRWTAPVPGQLTLDTTGADYDTLLAAYAGDSLGTLALLAANDDNPGTAPRSLVRLTVAGGALNR